MIVPDFEPALDSGVAQTSTTALIKLRAAANGNDDYYNGAIVEIVRGTNAGQSRVIVDYDGTAKEATVDRPWHQAPSASTYVIHPQISPSLDTTIRAESNILAIDGNTAAATAMKNLYLGGLTAGTVDSSPAPTDTVFSDDGTGSFNAAADYYNKSMLIMTSGANIGQARRVLDYAADAFTLDEALETAPSAGDTFVVLGIIV